MWPLDLLRRRTYKRQYNAAVAVFLGSYGLDRLSADERSRVEAQVEQNFDKSIYGPKVAEFRGDLLAAECAAAVCGVSQYAPCAVAAAGGVVGSSGETGEAGWDRSYGAGVGCGPAEPAEVDRSV